MASVGLAAVRNWLLFAGRFEMFAVSQLRIFVLRRTLNDFSGLGILPLVTRLVPRYAKLSHPASRLTIRGIGKQLGNVCELI